MNFLKDWAKTDEEAGSFGRYSILLASLVSLLVALPLFRSVPGGGIRFSVLLCLVLISAVYVNSRYRWSFVLGILLGGGAIVALIINEATGSTISRLVSGSLGLTLISWTTLVMLNALIRAERVSRDTVVGGICVYLMMGLAFTIAYTLAINLDPGVLLYGGFPLGDSVVDGSARSAKILYFSFVTLTTLGFGEITPSGEWTQMLAIAEAVIGQLYIAIFIARLMSLYVAGDRERRMANAPKRNE